MLGGAGATAALVSLTDRKCGANVQVGHRCGAQVWGTGVGLMCGATRYV